MDKAALRYWGEPEIVYAVNSVVFWNETEVEVRKDQGCIGFLPVFETVEEAREIFPDEPITKVVIYTEKVQ